MKLSIKATKTPKSRGIKKGSKSKSIKRTFATTPQQTAVSPISDVKFQSNDAATSTPAPALKKQVQLASLVDYSQMSRKKVLLPEIEMGLTPVQLEAIEFLIFETFPKLTPEQQNQLNIQMLKKKAAMLRGEYAANPRAQEVVQDFAKKGRRAESLARNSKVYLGDGYGDVIKLKHRDHIGESGFVLDELTVSKAKSVFGEKNMTQDSPVDLSAPTPKANANEDSESAKALQEARVARRRAKNQKAPWHKYYELTKPRISQLVAVTGLWGYLSVGNPIDWKDLGLLTVGTIAMSSSASIINQMRETDVDAKMTRTMARPLVTGSITMESAKKQAIAYTAIGSAFLAPLHTMVPILGLSNIVLYSGIYTSLKRTTRFNTEVGALVGAIPPMMGYFAALNTDQPWDTNMTALLYPAAMMIAWQIQHVMLICARRADEYNASGLVMQCKDDPNLKSTIRKGIAWSAISTALAAVPFFTGQADITQLFAVYIWALYTIPYAIAMKKQNQKHLGSILLAGYAVLGITIILSIMARVPLDPFEHLITAGPEHPTPLPDKPPSFLDVMIGGQGRPVLDAPQIITTTAQPVMDAEAFAASQIIATPPSNIPSTPLVSLESNMQSTSAVQSTKVQQDGLRYANMIKQFFRPKNGPSSGVNDL